MKKIISVILATVMFATSFATFGASVQAATVEENLKAAGFSDSYIDGS